MPIQLRQARHRPRRMIQLSRGRFSHQASEWSQLRQWERGVMMLSASGKRVRKTLRKLPKARPSSAAKMVPRKCGSVMISFTLPGFVWLPVDLKRPTLRG
jgi:hypothetical protein